MSALQAYIRTNIHTHTHTHTVLTAFPICRESGYTYLVQSIAVMIDLYKVVQI